MNLEELSLKVYQYWELGKGWKWDRLAELLPTVTLLKLYNTMLELEDGSADQVGWLSAKRKKFRVNSAYKLEVNWNYN